MSRVKSCARHFINSVTITEVGWRRKEWKATTVQVLVQVCGSEGEGSCPESTALAVIKSC